MPVMSEGETLSNCEWLYGYNMLQTAVYSLIFWTAGSLLIKREVEEVKVFNSTGSSEPQHVLLERYSPKPPSSL
jgi:hypothetical protein